MLGRKWTALRRPVSGPAVPVAVEPGNIERVRYLMSMVLKQASQRESGSTDGRIDRHE